MRTIPRAERRRVAGRLVLTLVSSPRFSVAGIRPGATVGELRKALDPRQRIVTAGSSWFTSRSRKARLLFKVMGGRVAEAGIADRRLTATPRALRRFLRFWPKL